MKITMLAVGSRGDVQPFIALGQGLKAQGHTVRLATHGIFEDFVRANGLDFAPLEGNPQSLLESEENRAWFESGRNPLNFARGFRELMGPVIYKAVEDSMHAAADADALVVTGPAFYFGHSVAQKLKVPFIQAYVQPIYPTGDFPSPLFPAAVSSKNRFFNQFTYMASGYTFWQLLRPVINNARRDFLQLPPISVAGPFAELMKMGYPVISGFSEAVIPKPRDWKDWLHITGYWFLEQPAWTPPAALLDFLNAGPAPVYIGFGSMADRNPERMTEIALGALKQSGQRGILLTGWGGLSQSDLPDTVMKIESVPHDWLFPHMAAVVHHGGAGTTAAGLRAGKPTIVLPFFGDQPFWGQRVAELGAGRMLSRKTLTVDQLGGAIRDAVIDQSLRSNAAAVGEAIRAENGVERASTLITRHLESLKGRVGVMV